MKAIKSDKDTNNSIKRERFIRIIERRVNNILDNLDSLGKCSNKKNYEYNNEDIKKIFNTIEKKLKEVKLFYEGSRDKKKRFSLK
jgi:hypothetical protein